jgi:predicted nucleotidyltransferase
VTLRDAVRRIHADLRELDVAHALVGGLAVSARTEPRFTRDADLAVAVRSDTEAENLILRLQGRGYRVEAIVEQDAAGRLATVRLAPEAPPHAPVIDLLFASSGIEPEVVSAAEPLELLSGLVVPIARPGHLIALKVLSRDDRERPQDVMDLRALLRTASEDDLDLARNALEMIAARGFHRGRDLLAHLDLLLS